MTFDSEYPQRPVFSALVSLRHQAFAVLAFNLAVIVAAGGVAGAGAIHVPGDWPTIQGAIDAASSRDSIIVSCGTYAEHDIEMRTDVSLFGQSGNPDCVTIDAQGMGRCLLFQNVVGWAVVRGITFTNGTGPGAGVRCQSSTVEFENCVFVDNVAYPFGDGGLACSGASVTLSNCRFQNNTGHVAGGAGFHLNSTFEITDCEFVGNTANNGGGLFISESFGVIEGSVVRANQASNRGGGMWVTDYSGVTIRDCLIVGNSGMSHGSGITIGFGGHPVLINTVVAFSPHGEAIHCALGGSSPWLECCDVYGNAGGDWVDCIADAAPSNGNFSLDPLFCDWPAGDLSVRADSPCAPSPGSTGCGVLGDVTVGCGTVPVEESSFAHIKSAYR